MGLLSYADGAARVFVPDRALAHVQLVITGKFRRGEAFLLTWRIDLADGCGRISVWLDPRIPLSLEYVGDGAVTVNVAWLELLFESANSPGGLHFLDEPRTGLDILPDPWLDSMPGDPSEPEDGSAA